MALLNNTNGLLETSFKKTTGRTGLARMRTVTTSDGKQRIGFTRVSHPVDTAPDVTTRGLQPNIAKQELNLPFLDLKNAYHTDGYVRQAVDKYAEKVISAGYLIECDDDNIKKYLNLRFYLMGQASGYPFPLLISDTVRRFIRDGNSFLVKQWVKEDNPYPGIKLNGLLGRKPMGALFVTEAEHFIPLIDRETGIRKAWIYRYDDYNRRIKDRLIELDQVYHFAYFPEGLDNWGYSQNIPAVEDIRALRAAEEAVLKLIYRHLNPLIHISTPDVMNDGSGRQEDIDTVVQMVSTMAHDGFVVTGPNYKLDVVGSESQALRAEAYLNFFKKRGFAGLGTSSIIMGEDTYMGAGGANAVDVQMHDRARHYQWLLGTYITYSIVTDLLTEGGYEILKDDGTLKAEFKFLEFDSDEIRKEQNHYADLFDKSVITRAEARKILKKEPLSPAEEKDTIYAIKSQYELAKEELKAKMKPKPSVKSK